MSADQLTRAAAKLRPPQLPGLTTVPVRIVHGDYEEHRTALAWCDDHTHWHGTTPDDPEVTACMTCRIVEFDSEPLAELVRDLLAAREPLADLLGVSATMWPPTTVTVEPPRGSLVTITRAILGELP